MQETSEEENRRENKGKKEPIKSLTTRMIIPFYYEHNVCFNNSPSPATRISYSSSVSVSVSVSLSLSSSSSVPDS